MNVTAYCLGNSLVPEEMIRDAEQVVAELRMQEEKTAKKVGPQVTTADLLQIRSPISRCENDVLTARNTYDITAEPHLLLRNRRPYDPLNRCARCQGAGSFRHADSPAEVFDAAREPRNWSTRGHRRLQRPAATSTRSHGLLADARSQPKCGSIFNVRQKMFGILAGTIGTHARNGMTISFRAAPIRGQCEAKRAMSLSLNIPIFGSSRSARTCGSRSSPCTAGRMLHANGRETGGRRLRRRRRPNGVERRDARYVASAEAAQQIERKYDLGAPPR